MPPALEPARSWGDPFRWGVMAAALAILVWNLDLRREMLFQYRTELGGVEHNVVHGTQKVMLGLTLYQDPEAIPFDVIQYTPAYYVLCAGLGKVLGISGEDARSVYLLGRTIALALNLLLLWSVFRICRVCEVDPWTSALAAIVAFCSLWEHSYARMDALSGTASLAAAWAFIRWTLFHRNRQLIVCALMASLSIMAKQSGVTALMVPLLYLTVHGQWKALWTFAAASALALSAMFGTALFLGSPWHMYQNIVQGLANGFSFMMWNDLFEPRTYKYFIGWHLLALLVAVMGIRAPFPPLRYLALAIPVSLLFALITGLKYGSRLNYLHESLVLTFIGAAVFLSRAPEVPWRKFLIGGFSLYGLLFAAFRTNSTLAWYRVGEPDSLHREAYLSDLAVRDVLIDELHLRPNEYLYITYRDHLEHFFVGQSLLTQKDIIQFSKGRLFDLKRFHEAMQDGTVRFVITDDPNGPITVQDSSYLGWEPVRAVNGRTILARSDRP